MVDRFIFLKKLSGLIRQFFIACSSAYHVQGGSLLINDSLGRTHVSVSFKNYKTRKYRGRDQHLKRDSQNARISLGAREFHASKFHRY